MAGKRRHWKEKNGRFWARIAIPIKLRPFFGGKSELIEPLGGDLRIADRNHAAAVARLQTKLDSARSSTTVYSPHGAMTFIPGVSDSSTPEVVRRPLTDADVEHAVWENYTRTLADDASRRAAMPTPEEIELERERVFERIAAGDVDVKSPTSVFNLHTDFELKARARMDDANLRTRRLAALKNSLATGETRFVDADVKELVQDNRLAVDPGSREWRELAEKIMRAQVQALERTLEYDRGVFGGSPTDPLVRAPMKTMRVSLQGLFRDYMDYSKTMGKHLDGGAKWQPPIRSLSAFLGHDDASRITPADLLRWRDTLLAEGKSPKTVSDKYLAAVRAVLNWAVENLRLPTNAMEKVRQKVPKKVKTRESGFTTPEAVRILKLSLNYLPAESNNPSNRESAHIVAAKHWVPLLCAFTGARVTELTQLRKQDFREEDGRWIARITPDGGSVKSSEYRDVPLHRQVVDLGFMDFVRLAGDGPLFHRGTNPETFLAKARATSGRLSAWLQDCGAIPQKVQPSHGWRHRFKTQGRELGMSDRVLDAIQGHSGRSASDDYGDVTIAARLRLIDALPNYDLGDGQSDQPDARPSISAACAR